MVDPSPIGESIVALAVQRRHYINLMWEWTQSAIAFIIVAANIVAAFYPTSNLESAAGLRNAAFLVIGFYFGRTNHTRPASVRVDDIARDET